MTNTRDAKLYVVATEGANTERSYFEAFNPSPSLRSPFSPSPVVVKMLPSVDHRSSPKDVLSRLRQFVRTQGLDTRDELWLVLDVDRWPTHTLLKVTAAAQRDGYHVAISNPCFEVWLCFHLEACNHDAVRQASQPQGVGNSPGENLKRLLRQTLGSYNEARPDPAIFHPHRSYATARAREHDDLSDDHLPPCPGTRVYLLVESLLEALAR